MDRVRLRKKKKKGGGKRERSPILLRSKAVSRKWRHLSPAPPSLPRSPPRPRLTLSSPDETAIQVTSKHTKYTDTHGLRRMDTKATQRGLIRREDKRSLSFFFCPAQTDKHYLARSQPACLYSALICSSSSLFFGLFIFSFYFFATFTAFFFLSLSTCFF